ncbi:STAS domain-containing protein [Streptomyces sp. RKAG337]|uniref:STAS domain-containing protein n=1 Tax=Streptomyces sp. RKAG337 TaxID=2893404 RepID=UPI002034A73F|nr:STAS domain-containing protein [Streptomyces sp. RKAG337]MCM2431037.1 STAS domain-containing protein [Streptomyces sp. RKAG337]
MGDDGNPVIAFEDALLTHRPHEHHTVITVEGELGVYEAPALRDQLTALIDQVEGDVVLNMLAVNYLDSTSLGVLVGALLRLRQQPARALHVVSAEGLVHKVLRITGLAKVFDLHPTVADALQAASLPPPAADGPHPLNPEA